MICISLLFSCSEGGADTEFKMKATVTALGEKLEVDVTEAEYAEGTYWIIVSDTTEILNGEGKKIIRDEISVGDEITITYNGQVMMSLPPQVAALKIQLVK